MTLSFAVTWDYRCPFARNAHEHLLTALESGADWDVRFVPFSLRSPARGAHDALSKFPVRPALARVQSAAHLTKLFRQQVVQNVARQTKRGGRQSAGRRVAEG